MGPRPGRLPVPLGEQGFLEGANEGAEALHAVREVAVDAPARVTHVLDGVQLLVAETAVLVDEGGVDQAPCDLAAEVRVSAVVRGLEDPAQEAHL